MEVARLTSMCDFSSKKNAQDMVANELPDLEKLIAEIEKSDPKWDVKAYERFSKDAWTKQKATQRAVDEHFA